jgi:putative FmdB family regulatory protein
VRYPFRCTRCGLEFEVSRPIREAGEAASCPADGAAAQRIFTVPSMNMNRPAHSHGPGAAHHSH